VFQLCHCSEKLVIAFQLINPAPSSPLGIKKICGFFKIATFPRRFTSKILRDERITLMPLKMVFVCAWTYGNASNQCCQSLCQVHFVLSNMSSGLMSL
jgi:hypothetical protein